MKINLKEFFWALDEGLTFWLDNDSIIETLGYEGYIFLILKKGASLRIEISPDEKRWIEYENVNKSGHLKLPCVPYVKLHLEGAGEMCLYFEHHVDIKIQNAIEELGIK